MQVGKGNLKYNTGTDHLQLYRVDYTDNIEDIDEEDNERQSLKFEVEFGVISLLHT